jgi:hypothetical protein
LARAAGVPLQQIVEEAVAEYRRQRVLRETNAACAAVWTNPTTAGDLDAERAAWDATLADGLEDI